jgi:hypothetical protein
MHSEYLSSNDSLFLLPAPELLHRHTWGSSDFVNRFTAALEEEPMNGLLVDDNAEWTPWYKKRMKTIDTVCIDQGICKHDILHLLRVARNAMVLNDTLGQKKIPDSILFSLILVHDIGYSLSGLHWSGKEAVNHAQREVSLMKRWAGIFAHTQKEEIVTYISCLPGSRHEVLNATQSFSTEIFNHKTNTLPVLIKLADVCDYFHQDRVANISAPSEGSEYFHLARPVLDYSLVQESETNTIKHGIRLEEEQIDFSTWCSEVHIHYPEVWSLGSEFARHTGQAFEVGPLN